MPINSVDSQPFEPSKRSFYRSDPAAYLLINKLHLSPLSFGLFSSAIAIGFYLFMAWVSNTLYSKPGQVGLLEDWFPWVWILFFNPIVVGYYLWSFQAIERLIKDLDASDVVETNKPEIYKEELLQEITRQFQTDYSQIRLSLTGDAETFKKGNEKIKELRAFYTLTDEFPVWPFDVQTFRRFLLTVPSPLLPLLPKLIGTLLKKWGIDLG